MIASKDPEGVFILKTLSFGSALCKSDVHISVSRSFELNSDFITKSEHLTRRS
jgi:hypothetical protein